MACTPQPETANLTPHKQPEPKRQAGPSLESQKIAAYYAVVQERLQANGRLRQDPHPHDAPFTSQDLVKNFERIALFDEYSVSGGQFIQRQTASSLRRWERPVRIGLVFGPSVPPEQRMKDTAYVRSFAARLASLTGLDIRLTKESQANFTLLFLNRDEQKHYIPKLVRKVNFLIPQITTEIKNSPRNIFCAAYAISEPKRSAGYKGAVLLIKAEHLDIMRKSCIQEEMAQALGLANDSPAARPSIFNDDEEFALLTGHDELLLRILYDKRLKIGMTAKSAHPIVQKIVHDIAQNGES